MNPAPVLLALAPAILFPAQEAVETVSAEARVVGTLSLPGGAPAAGVVLRLDAQPLGARSSEWSWTPVARTSDENGAIRLPFEPPSSALFTLTLERQGFVSETWRWSSQAPDEQVDLGTFTLRPAGVIVGQVKGRVGPLAAGQWTLWADPAEGMTAGGGRARLQPVRGRFEANGLDTSFRIEGLPAGATQLRLDVAAAGRYDGPRVEVSPGRVVDAVVEYPGPDLARRVHITLSTRPVHAAYPSLENVRLFAPDGSMRVAYASDRVRRGVDFDGLDPDLSYRLEIDDPYFEPFVLEDLVPGHHGTTVSLEGNCTLVLFAEDAYTHELVHELDVHLRLFDDTFPAELDPWLTRNDDLRQHGTLARPGRMLLHSARHGGLIRGAIRGLVAGNYTLILEAPGRAQTYAPLVGLEPGETREVSVELFEGGTLAGSVREAGADGTARAGVRLHLFHPGMETAPPLGRALDGAELHPVLLGQGYERASAFTNAAGEFSMAGVAPGTYTLRLRTADGRLIFREGVQVKDREATRVDVILPER